MGVKEQGELKMTRQFVYLTIIFVVIGSGCDAVVTETGPVAYTARASLLEMDIGEQESLFSSDSAVLTDEDIKRILAYDYIPQKQNRIGILSLGRSYWYGWSDELARTGVEVQEKLVSKLRSSTLIFDASFLPSLLIPEKKTVAYFREAGARYQADLLLIYQASCRTYEKYRFLSPDKAKSYCNVEAVLLDIRTGIVPFTVTASRNFTAEKKEGDLNLNETIRRTELNAISEALEEVGDEVVKFLEKVAK